MRETLEVLAVVFLCLSPTPLAESYLMSTGRQGTYVRHPTVRANGNLRLIHVDENPRMTQWPTAPVAGDAALLCPANRLLVNQLDSRVWSRLHQKYQLPLSRHIAAFIHTPDLP